MKKDRKSTYLRLGILVVLVICLTVLLELIAAAISPLEAKSTVIKRGDENDLKAVNVLHVYRSAYRLEDYNHVSGRFLIPGEEINNEPHSAVGARGTYVYVIQGATDGEHNLPDDIDNIQKGDKLYHLTLYLPAFHGAAVVYLDGIPVLHFGEIEGYDYAAHGINGSFTGSHKPSSAPAYVDIALDLNKHATEDNPLNGTRILTVHYESQRDFKPAFSRESPLIGSENAVVGAVENNKLVLLAFSALSLFTLACACFATLVRSFRFFFPLVVMSTGFFGVGLTSFMLLSPTSLVYLYEAFLNLSYITILIGASLCFCHRLGRLYLRLSLSIPLSLIGIFFFARPFMNGTLNRVAEPIFDVYFAIALVLFITYTILSVYKGEHFSRMFAPTLTVFILAYRFIDFSAYSALLSPIFWLCCALMVYLAYHVITQVVAIERRNAYLARNLQAEVERQTAQLQKIVVERENALRFLSHDLRKPTRTIHLLLATLISRESDPEQIKTMRIVEQKLALIESDLSEISRALKESCVSEPSETIEVGEMLSEIYAALLPDCVANGIHLRYTPARVIAYVKRQALKSVISNLIINAIEHASCDTIVLTLGKKGSNCVIKVADNGIGMEKTANESDPFALYESGQETDGTHGLGLYICRTYVESMQGTIKYEYTEGELIFTVTLPLA